MIGELLSQFGRRGPTLLVASLCVGFAFHPLARIGYQLLPISAFLLTLGSFLTASLSPAESRLRLGLVGIALLWVGVALPLLAAGVLLLLPLDPALHAGIMLSLLAPPVGSAAAMAAMMGLRPRVALIVSLTLTLSAPLTIPAYSTMLGLGIDFRISALALRLFLIVGAAALVSCGAIKFRRRLTGVLPDQRAATGVAVVGLVIVGLATSQAIQAQGPEHSRQFAAMLVAATIVNFGLCAVSALIFARLGPRLAGTVGLVSGNRNVTLAWAAAGVGLPPLTEAYVAACVIPVLALPLIVRMAVELRGSLALRS